MKSLSQWIVSFLLLGCAVAGLVALAAESKEGSWTSLFNGKDLDGWIGDTKAYAVKDGVMVFTGKSGDIFTQDTYSNFAFRF